MFPSDSNEIRTHNHLFRKRALNHLAKLARISLLPLKFQIWRLLRSRSFLTFKQKFALKLVRDMIITYNVL